MRNKLYKHILFDLDGTLTRSDAGIIACVEHALTRLNHPVPSREILLGFVGPRLGDSFRDICGLPADEVHKAVELFREQYDVTGMYENEVYAGIPQLLAALAAGEMRLYVATSKVQASAEAILAHFGLARYFAAICGSRPAANDETKGDIIARLLAGQGIAPGGAVMVGDRHHDIEGAGANGLPSIGVLYGYGSREELTAAGAGQIADDVPMLGRILLGGEAG